MYFSVSKASQAQLLCKVTDCSKTTVQSSHALMYEEAVSQLETSPKAARHPESWWGQWTLRLLLTVISPLKIRDKSLCEKENVPVLNSHLAYRRSVLLLRCSTMDPVTVLGVIISPESLQLDLHFTKIRITPEFPGSLALYSWFDSYCYQFRLIWSLNPVYTSLDVIELKKNSTHTHTHTPLDTVFSYSTECTSRTMGNDRKGALLFRHG